MFALNTSLYKLKRNFLGDNSYISMINNCTQCGAKLYGCICFQDRLNECMVCCSENVPCCLCYDCTPCSPDWQFDLMTDIIFFIFFVSGLIGFFIIVFKICEICHRPMRNVLQEQELDRTRCSTIEDLEERLPSYNEVSYSAPPLYTSPYNRASMQEAPPSYPGTPKPQERSQATDDQTLSRHTVSVASSIAQHM